MKRILIAILSFFILPLAVYASNAVNNVDFDIKQDYFNVHILDNGDVKVQELIRYDGSFNGVYLNLAFGNTFTSYSDTDYASNAIYNFDGYKNVKISAKKLDKVSFDTFNNLDGFKKFEETDYAISGDEFVYTLDSSFDEDSYKIFYPVHNDSVVFLYEYTLDKPVVIHDDVAELYWQIFDTDPVRQKQTDVSVKVYLPESDTKDTFRIWTHDILSSTIKYIEDDGELIGFEVHADKIVPDDLFDIRTTFDKDLIINQEGLDRFYGEGLKNILEVEEERAQLANEEREHLRKVYNFYKYASYVLLITCPILFVIIYFLYALKPKTNFFAKYYREFIDDYNVEVIDYLYHKGLTSNAFSAAIMNLVYLKKIDVEELHDGKDKGKKKEYKFKLLSKEDLDESNLYLVEFLFDRIGKDNEVTTKDIKSYAASTKTGSKFNTSYTKWNSKVKSIGVKQNFFKSKAGAYLMSIIYLFISLIIMSTGSSRGVDLFTLYLPFILSIVLFIYVCFIKAYNEKGALHVKKWNAFKNFLNDFGTFELKELPEIKLWERYLVYATMFGLADKVQKVMNVKIKEVSEFDSTYSGTTFTHLYMYDSLRHTVNRAVSDGRRQYAASRANAYSSHSSGGGFGGGGSFGGGFGGGGGGRGGF